MKLSVLTLLFLTFTTIVFGQSTLEISPEQRALLDEIALRDVPKNAPGIATGIISNGKIMYTKYGGYAHLKDSTLIDSHSRFNIASDGKQFTALAILDLINDKKMTLEDDLRLYFPEFYPGVKEKIKIKNLLNHTSGIRDVHRLWGLQGITWWKQTFDNKDALKILSKQTELNFVPGTDYSYSNSNYILLAEIVSKVSGESFIVYTNKMFKELGMPNTSFESDYETIRGPIAKPYFNFNTWTSYKWICNIYGDGNIFSTLEDQLQWEKIVQTQQTKRFSKELIIESQSIIPSDAQKKYGYGLEFEEYKGVPYTYHEGATGAWKSIIARFSNFSIVTLTNSGKVYPKGQTLEMANLFLDISDDSASHVLTPPTEGAKVTIDEAIGIYQTENGYTFEIVEKDGEMYLLRSGRNDTKLLRENDNTFYQWNDPTFKQEFIKNNQGEMQITAYHTSHAPYTLTRAENDFTNYNYNALNGDYVNDETEVIISVQYDQQNKYIVKRGKKTMDAVLISPNQLLANNYNYQVEIVKNSKGEISDLLLSSGRIQNVRFTKK